jgi:hypothetical protein
MAGGTPTAPPGTPPGGQGAKSITRFEFVVMFVWREPTPSDALMKLGEPGSAPAEPGAGR